MQSNVAYYVSQEYSLSRCLHGPMFCLMASGCAVGGFQYSRCGATADHRLGAHQTHIVPWSEQIAGVYVALKQPRRVDTTKQKETEFFFRR